MKFLLRGSPSSSVTSVAVTKLFYRKQIRPVMKPDAMVMDRIFMRLSHSQGIHLQPLVQ
jgi:hypothetical protein